METNGIKIKFTAAIGIFLLIVSLFVLSCKKKEEEEPVEPPPPPPVASNDATLSNLVISTGRVDNVFSATTVSYLAEMSGGTNSVDITATTANSKASLTINGAAVTSGTAKTISLNLTGGNVNIDVVVTAEDGTTKKTYTVTAKESQIDVKSGTTPTLDGVIGTTEWSGATTINLYMDTEVKGTVKIMHDGQAVWVGYSIYDNTQGLDHFGDRTMVYVDTDYDQNSFPQQDDYFFVMLRGDTIFQSQGLGTNAGNASDWDTYSPMGAWISVLDDQVTSWSVEYKIPYSDLGIVAGTPKTIGMNFGTTDSFTDWPAWVYEVNYPLGTNWLTPKTWGRISSSDNWQ